MTRSLLFLALFPVLSFAQTSLREERQKNFGAVQVPAALPSGATALYAFVGVPELGLGFRQGTDFAEVEARARANYLQLSLALELGVKREVLRVGDFALAPSFFLGLVLNSGSTYFDAQNFSAASVRLLPGLIATYAVSDTVRLLGLVDIPVDLAFAPSSAQRVQALAGGGAEIYLGQELSLLAAAQLGVETFKQPLAVAESRLGYAFRLGLGYRLF